MTRRITLQDVRASYGPDKAREEWHGDWMSALLYRPLSFYLTVPLLALGASASQVTLLGLLCAFLCLPAAWLTGQAGYFAVGGLSLFFVILDCVDGNIARVTKSASTRGHYLDFATDIMFRICLYAAIGILAAREAPSAALLQGHTLSAALLAVILTLTARLCRMLARQISPGDVYEEREPADPAKARPLSLSTVLFALISGVDRLLPLLVLGAAFWGGLGWLLLWLVLYGLLDLIYSQWAIFRRF